MGSKDYYFPPSDEHTQLSVWHSLMNGSGSIGYDLESSDYVLTMGANILDNWGSVVRNQALFGMDKFKLVYTGPVQNNTSAVADEYLPMHCEAQGHLALALAYYVMRAGITIQNISGFGEFYNYVNHHYSPRKAREKTGIAEDIIYKLAKELLEANNPLVIQGSLNGEGEPGFAFYAALCLNSLLKFQNKGGINPLPSAPQVIREAPEILELKKNDLYSYLQELKQGNKKLPEVLFVYEANPVYSLPNKKLINEVFDQIPLKVSFSPFMDETAARSDLILPTPYFLERYDDAFTPFGSGKCNYSLAAPVMQPITDSKTTPEVILELAAKLGLGINIDSYKSLLQKKANLLNADWSSLIQGNMWTSERLQPQKEIQLWNKQIERLLAQSNSSISKDNTLHLVEEDKLRTGTHTTAFAPFQLKTFREEEIEKNLIYARLNRETARKFNLVEQDKVNIVSPNYKCPAKIQLDEGIITNVVVVPTGFGHRFWDKFSRNIGDNVNKLPIVQKEKGSGLIYWNYTKVELQKI